MIKDEMADGLTKDEEADLVRQGERTVDNLKRLFAVIFALSFGIAGASVIGRIEAVLSSNGPLNIGRPLLLLNLEMLVVFTATAAIFYHHGAKFLDHRYASKPWSEAHPIGFALDFITLVLTMVPFYFMAHSLRSDITHKVGYTMYFWSYSTLIYVGLLLLVLAEIRHLPVIRERVFHERLSQNELSRDRRLRSFWFVMNCVALIVVMKLFDWQLDSGNACPTNGDPSKFLYAFGVVAVARDILDYVFAWRYIYPVPSHIREKKAVLPIRIVTDHLWVAYAISLASISYLTYLIFWEIQMLDVGKWLAACRV
ncbi:heme exporter protein D [Azospirillum fermentarium]|uniref:hypothetical protein n=1 Tax=Azospirillum fermentarium TaxID=1233114 RepID=UPI0022269369|nr:hypothetical protein [Azospirillum fermentarium]MCW2249242.1 heme exporter protein D [Azospirillum fermentarium]